MRKYATLPALVGDLMSVITFEGIQASNDKLYKWAIFGRDSLTVGLDLVPYYPALSARILISLARLQGKQFDPVSEEEPGRIHHEYRNLTIGGEVIGPEQAAILHELADKWGGTDTEVCYYGSVDATPQFVRLLAKQVSLHGPEILTTRIVHRDGSTSTLAEAALAALAWLSRRLDSSELGLLEFCRTNPRGNGYQVMRDGYTSYLHEDGTRANVDAPIASIDVQGLAYDALLDGAELFPDDANCPVWLEQAATLRQVTLERFWMPDRQSFAMALDRAEVGGQPRLVKTATSLPAELLDTRLFDGLSEDAAEMYITSLITEMFSPEFLTPVGLRMRGLKYADLLPYWDYQGTEVSWAFSTNLFARGLRRQQGFDPLAEDAEDLLINGINKSRQCVELWYVAPDGRVIYFPTTTPGYREVIATNLPERTHAWTVSAAIRAVLAQADYSAPTMGWKIRLVAKIQAELRAPYRGSINHSEARRLEADA